MRVVQVSTELDEIIQLSDRIAVMFRGKILTILEAGVTSKNELGLLMAGIMPELKKKEVKKIQKREIVT